ncbi:MAG: hypothetical protein ACYDBB_21470, partial [Armatimonadota bacterium]
GIHWRGVGRHPPVRGPGDRLRAARWSPGQSQPGPVNHGAGRIPRWLAGEQRQGVTSARLPRAAATSARPGQPWRRQDSSLTDRRATAGSDQRAPSPRCRDISPARSTMAGNPLPGESAGIPRCAALVTVFHPLNCGVNANKQRRPSGNAMRRYTPKCVPFTSARYTRP